MNNLNTVLPNGTFGMAVSLINDNFSLIVNAINSLEYASTKSKGIHNYGFVPSATTIPNAVSGDWCMVLREGNTFPADIWTYNGTSWSKGGAWTPEGIDLTDYASKTELNAAVANSVLQATALVGYYQCTVNSNQLAVTAPGFTLPAHGGNIRIKMSAPATGASTLNINGTGAKALLYNGAAVSSANTWEQNEIISVFYDPSGSGQYLASNSQGGGGKIKVDEDVEFDFSIQDENNKAIAGFANGHVRTKNFNSADVPTRVEVESSHPVNTADNTDYDFLITDEGNKAIAVFKNGHVRTKNFNSADAVMNGLVGSQIKRYKRQTDECFPCENIGLIGNWVKRTLNGTPVVSSYSWGSELLFQVKRTTSVSANFILDSITAPVIAYQVDDGEWSTTNVASTISIATGLNAYEHIIRIRVSSCTLNETMFTNGSGMVNFAGLTVDNKAVITPLDVNNRKILFIGDSITGGVGSSVWQGYAYLLADMLNAANIQSALAGGGLAHGSRTYLPTAAQVLREMIQGSNNVINEPDVILIMLGTNDGSQTSAADFTTGYSNLLKYIRKRFGGCHIFACSPFNGTHQSDTQAATLTVDNVTWIPTTELAGTYSTSDGTHPDVAGAKVCADYCYKKITKVLYLNYFN